MKKIRICENEHTNLNPRLKYFLRELDKEGVLFRFKLADRLQERGLTVRRCSELTGLRLATISDLMNGNKSSINLHHIIVIMVCLRISKLEDLVEIYIPDSIKDEFDEEAMNWVTKGELSKKIESLSPFWSGEYDDVLSKEWEGFSEDSSK